MPIVVHIADARNVSSILRSGLRPGKGRNVVYFMPVVQSHTVSHQWLRELKRSGAKELVGVYVRLRSQELVWAGRYTETHTQVRLGEAIRQLNALKDPLGHEVFIDRKITANEVQRVRALPQVIGWRYQPHAHGRTLCGCPACLPRGSIKSRHLRARLDPKAALPSLPELRARLAETTDTDEILDCLWPLRMKRRVVDPSFLLPFLKSNAEAVLEELALTLPYFRHPETRTMLSMLCQHSSPAVSQTARESLEAYSVGRTELRRET